jgi:DNA-binding response OmpR family regulator
MGPRILVCDDEPHIALALCMKFSNAGFEVETARDGEEGWRALQASPPDLMICDCSMPGIDGLELCQRVRNDPALRGLPIILLTARGLELEPEHVHGTLGIAKVVLKPFSPRDLLRDVQETLQLAVAR